ncbi:hypothetical protein LDENG_00294890 [Lucifuga dentata]|nr:hypothetical protein LDENG_00294890 [Lucifuga dentata]
MNRKERIARRLEGIESDAPPALMPGGLVANRMLEEDPPRYTRASDPCEPRVMVRRYSREEKEVPQKQVSSPDRSSQVKGSGGISRPEPVLVYVEPVTVSTASAPTSGPSDPTSLSSKAERIARYKAERRRQLSERYGILLDQEIDIDYTPRRDIQEIEEPGRDPRVPYRSGVGRVYMRTHQDPTSVSTSSPAHTNQAPPHTQERSSRFSERERMMNMENYRRGGAQEHSVTSRIRAQEQHLPSPQQQQQDVSQEEASPAPTRDYSVAAMPSSPHTARRASLPSTRYGISPGDLFIEQQAQSILNRQGRSGVIRVRERLSGDETIQRPPEWSPDRYQASRHRAQGNTAQYVMQGSEHSQQRTVPQPQPSLGPQPAHGQAVRPPIASEPHHSGPAVDHQPYLAMPAPVTNSKVPGPPEVPPRRRVSADQICAAHREAKLEARQALKEEAHTEGLLKSRKAVLPSEVRRREKSVDDTHRGQHEDMEWQNSERRMSQEEKDWNRERPRERGRERMTERMRERGKEHLSSYDNQEERTFKSTEHSYSSPHHEPRHWQTSDPVCHQGLQVQQQEPPVQQYDPQKRQYSAQIQQQDTQREHRDPSRHPLELQRLSQRQQEYETRTSGKDLPRLQEESHRKHQEPQRDQEYELQREQDSLRLQKSDSAVYLQKGSSLPQAKHRSMEMSGGPKPKIRTRSMSDIGVSQHSAVYRVMERTSASRETALTAHHGRDGGMANGEMGTLDTRVSVAQLRHSYLENANRKPEFEPTKVDLSAMEVDPASGSDRDRGARRPRRYITPGDSRLSERFRTQPITSAERMESDRSRLSPSQLQDPEDEEKLDERAKMSVAAKRSLFRELERTSDGGVPKPRSCNAAVERRLRRVQDRSHTQPVTNMEVVNAASDPVASSQPAGTPTVVARIPSPTIVNTTMTNFSLQTSSQPDSAVQEQEKENQELQKAQKPAQAPSSGVDGDGQELVPGEPDLSALSLTEKMALFNRLSQTTGKTAEGAGTRGDTRQRRANARFQTQPITQGEVEQVQRFFLI